MSGSSKDWGHGKKVNALPIQNMDGELKTKFSAAKNPGKEKDSPMNNPLKRVK